MSTSKVLKYYCLESSKYFAHDILNTKLAVNDICKERPKHGEFHTVYEEIRKCPEKFFEYTRMSVETFDYILAKVRPHLTSSTNHQRNVSPTEKLFLTLRFLSTGLTFMFLRRTYRMGKSTIGKCIYLTCKVIMSTLSKDHMPKLTSEQLKDISNKFFLRWQFPNCVGAVGRKYFRVRKRLKESKRKQKSYLVMQAVVDYDYKFITTEVGEKGTDNNTEILTCSKLHKSIVSGKFNMPEPQSLPGSDIVLPHVLVGDSAYPLKTYLMRPYPMTKQTSTDEKKEFNYRLSQARVPIENAFEILSKKWKIFTNPLESNMIHGKLLIKVACLLHNIISDKDGDRDPDFCEVNSTGCQTKKVKGPRSNNRATFQAMQIRDQFKLYFNNSSKNNCSG